MTSAVICLSWCRADKTYAPLYRSSGAVIVNPELLQEKRPAYPHLL